MFSSKYLVLSFLLSECECDGEQRKMRREGCNDSRLFRNGRVLAQSSAQGSLLVADTSTEIINDIREEAGSCYPSGAPFPTSSHAIHSHLLRKERTAVQITNPTCGRLTSIHAVATARETGQITVCQVMQHRGL